MASSFSKLRIVGPIGAGGFGSLYKAVDKVTGAAVAIKTCTDKPQAVSQLQWEYEIYKDIEKSTDNVAWPRAYTLGHDKKRGWVLSMDLLGPSVDTIFTQHRHRLDPRFVAYFMYKAVHALMVFHNCGYVHRDIKAHNFVMELDYANEPFPEIFLIDYGLAKVYSIRDTGTHAPYATGKSLKGTVRYSSIHTHLGVEQSRRDDLESLGYVAMYLVKGTVPWQGINTKTQNRQDVYDKILNMKMDWPVERLLADIPNPAFRNAMASYMLYCKHLGYEEQPDYYYCMSLFKPFFAYVQSIHETLR
ncbi:hypothetical protein GGF32_003810 [Allomyces javanicus]|nr:hypothetical protein GGF32_003810 [Allomyces javanicus]